MALNVSSQFKVSYAKSAEYPCNLYDTNTYTTTLNAYKTRLEKAAETLCANDDSKVDIPFRDLLPSPQDPTIWKFKKQNIFSQAALKQWIGDESSIDPLSNTRTGSIATKPDPVVRFIFLHGADSQSNLKVTREVLVQLLSYHQVMPGFLEFLFLFGLQSRPVDLRYSGFREETCLGTPTTRMENAIGRSGKHFELCYNLKGVDERSSKTWSIRHAAVYHKFDVVSGNALWMIVKGSLDLKAKIEPITAHQTKDQDRHFKSPGACFGSSLAIHLLIAHWAGESWRWYLQHLEEAVEEETKDARYEDREKAQDIKVFTSRDLQNIQVYTEKANETVTIIESNIEVLSAIRQYYEDLVQNPHFPFGPKGQEDVSRLARQFGNIIYDLKMQKARAMLLVQEIQSRKDLILQHLQSQNTRSMEMLTMATYEVTRVAQKDAIAIRIITIVTLFYLPATFVSSFFSTDVVKYQDPNSSPPNSTTSYSGLAMTRWIEVTVPLTALTLIFAYAGYRYAKFCVRRSQRYELVSV